MQHSTVFVLQYFTVQYSTVVYSILDYQIIGEGLENVLKANNWGWNKWRGEWENRRYGHSMITSTFRLFTIRLFSHYSAVLYSILQTSFCLLIGYFNF